MCLYEAFYWANKKRWKGMNGWEWSHMHEICTTNSQIYNPDTIPDSSGRFPDIGNAKMNKII